MELHHLGVEPEDVPATVVLVSGTLVRPDAGLVPETVVERREFRSGRLADAPDVLVCAGGRGAPAAVIALEELRRSGATTVVLVTGCQCEGCGHGVVVPRGAVRGEGTSGSYAPPEFPAVPHHALAEVLVQRLGAVGTEVVHSVDVPPGWAERTSVAPGEPVDLESAAVLVAAAAGGMRAACVVIGTDAVVPGLLAHAAAAALEVG